MLYWSIGPRQSSSGCICYYWCESMMQPRRGWADSGARRLFLIGQKEAQQRYRERHHEELKDRKLKARDGYNSRARERYQTNAKVKKCRLDANKQWACSDRGRESGREAQS